MSTKSDDVDVVVVGAGLAGHVAALSAAEEGLRVALLEKGADFGGSSTRSGGGLIFAGTQLQQEAGFEDSPEALRKALTTAGRGMAKQELIDAYVTEQLETYEWLTAHGVAFTVDAAASSEMESRVHYSGQGVATRHLHDLVEKHDGIEYRASSPATRLTRGNHGRVDRVGIQSGEDMEWLNVSRSVVLTSGGFSRSTDLLRTFAPTWLKAAPMSGRHNTGDGLVMGWSLGAGLADMPYISATYGASVPGYFGSDGGSDETEPTLLFPNYRGALIVNRDGQRFANEDLQYKVLSGLCVAQPDGISFEIFDEPIFQQSDDMALPWDFKAALESGLITRADTVEELATALGLGPDALAATIDRYNAAIESGADPDFGRPMPDAQRPGGGKIATPPYYGYPAKAGLTSTFAGLAVDGSMRVLDVYDSPIDGLFAAGEVVGGFHGGGYYSGTGMGKAAVFGRIAGKAAAGATAP